MIDKLVWMDYFRGFHWRNILKNHKENNSFGGFLILFNAFVQLPIAIKILTHEKMVQENMLNYEVVINGEISW